MRFLIDQGPLEYQDRLHCMVRLDSVPEGVEYNDSDPFSPYFFCPEGMGFDIVYIDIVSLLEDFTTGEVSEIRKLIVSATDAAREQYRRQLEETLPGRDLGDYEGAAQMAFEYRKYQLLKMFPPQSYSLTTGKVVSESHLWAVYALEEFQLALESALRPPFADDEESKAETGYIEDMLDVEIPQRNKKPTKYMRAVRAIGRQKSLLMDASYRLVVATKHLQYAMVLMHSNRIRQDRDAAQVIQTNRMKGLAEINRLKEEAVELARKLAAANWKQDTNRSIRIGEMADIVYRDLMSQGHGVALPDSSDRLKEWIKPVAPDYARKGGRRKKTTHP
nr:hypothetical protein [uncultured Pseudomonas sp.]